MSKPIDDATIEAVKDAMVAEVMRRESRKRALRVIPQSVAVLMQTRLVVRNFNQGLDNVRCTFCGSDGEQEPTLYEIHAPTGHIRVSTARCVGGCPRLLRPRL